MKRNEEKRPKLWVDPFHLKDTDASFLREKHKTQKSGIKHVNQIYDTLDDLGGVALP